jgi:hypothetical protein
MFSTWRVLCFSSRMRKIAHRPVAIPLAAATLKSSPRHEGAERNPGLVVMLLLILLQIAVCAALVIYGLFMDMHDVHPVEKLKAWSHKLRLRHR